MSVIIIQNPHGDTTPKVTEQVCDLFSDLGVSYTIYEEGDNIGDETRFAVTVGGDGTIIRAAHLLLGRDIPIVGVNTGRLGFMTAIKADDLTPLKRLFTGDYTKEDRLMLFADMGDDNRVTALNDIVIASNSVAKTVDIEVVCDGLSILSYRGDGVIISTPTGSTAYSMSAGGPITDVSLSAIIVTPLSAHSLGIPPIVLSAKRELVIKTMSRAGGVKLCADGFEEYEVDGDVCIKKNRFTAPLIFFNKAEQLTAIEEKLHKI